VFCGATRIEGEATLEAGVHYNHGGVFAVAGDGRLTGVEVTLMMSRGSARIEFNDRAEVSLSAPTTEAWAGVVVAQNPTHTARPTSYIRDDARVELVGAVWLPQHSFQVQDQAQLGVRSDFIALVAYETDFRNNAVANFAADHEAVGFPDMLPRPYFVPRLLPRPTAP
jgi:hypothetical protein